ncbi:MAG: acyl-ACP--UDP-N-acetylglucosamine O-acyltransferase [Bacteroidota bacterium]|nr:acyl-ACP--UDP-N-acetylglucosamine O-acyltransferase [Bacteroidota bacterium]MDP4234114.1 acyl-ACP--UDP-N-acetylglucosamine O-acyltransferase [Bacteroidota bacterium]MDP4243055.1 acyl-ACP--UDP-N-acetylglucosamine O-acyltransferase [Bacteroidota bacterium]MDP4287481.1 acyl-ACP--UDP-N-acetylglucosamine O-acyltransferase [Bacteroidota bacterium]
MATTIHPTAIVDFKAKLADDVEIGAYAIVEGDVEIGRGTRIHHHVFLGNGARIGERCQIHHAAVVSNVPQDLKFMGTEKTYVELGDDSVVREFATIHRATIHQADTNAGTLDGVTRIGRGTLIMAYAHVAHDCKVGEGVILSNATQLAGHVTVEDLATIGGGGLVHQFCMIGTLSMIGGGAEVRKDVPPFSLIGGGGARFSGINRIGLARRGKSRETIQAIKSSYFTLYHSGLNVTAAVRSIEQSPESAIPEVQQILRFISLSKRGIIGAA